MLPEKNQYVYDLSMDILDGKEWKVPDISGFSERIIEVPSAAVWLNKFSSENHCHILDIGYTMSSLDWLGLLLKLNDKDNCSVNAIDIVRPERVKTRYPQEWHKKIFAVPVEIGDLREMPLNEGHYDVVTCISTIEHIGFDEAEEKDENTAFKRSKDVSEIKINRSPDVNKKVLAQFNKALKPGGHVIITTPMGKGGPTLLKDSLGLYTRQWEYEKDSWQDLINQPGFRIIKESFFGLNNDGIWKQVNSPDDLVNKSSELQPHAHGCAMVILKKI